MNKQYILIFVLLVLAVGGLYFYTQSMTFPESSILNISVHRNSPGQTPPKEMPPPASFSAVHDLKKITPRAGTYSTDAYVVKKYECPACPAGAACKPCMGDNIVISERNMPIDTYILSDTEILVFVKNPNQFELGRKYNFSIRLREDGTSDLVEYTAIK